MKKRGREEDAPTEDPQAEFMSEPEAPTSQFSQDPATMVGVDLSATDPAVISKMSREELEHFCAALLEGMQPASKKARRAFRARNLADQLRAVLGGGGTGRVQWKSAKYNVSLILGETMFKWMASGPSASITRLVRSEILEGKIPEFRMANGTDAHLFTGIPDAFDDGSYGFHMSPEQYIYHAGLFFEIDEKTSLTCWVTNTNQHRENTRWSSKQGMVKQGLLAGLVSFS